MMAYINAWSFSRLQVYETCPRQAKYKFIDKLPEEKHPAAARGIKVHDDCAQFLTGKLEAPTAEIKNFGMATFEMLRRLNPLVEMKIAFNADWKPTSWFGADAWCRMILDVALVYDTNDALVIDHKTGKKRDGYDDQLNLFATGMFAQYPECDEVDTRLWFLDAPDEVTKTIPRDGFEDMKTYWKDRAAPMLGDRTFAARPGQHCRWCQWSRTKGGPCEFG